ncbi:hypothetical protein Tco_0083464 [Tanacetum coccineum]
MTKARTLNGGFASFLLSKASATTFACPVVDNEYSQSEHRTLGNILIVPLKSSERTNTAPYAQTLDRSIARWKNDLEVLGKYFGIILTIGTSLQLLSSLDLSLVSLIVICDKNDVDILVAVTSVDLLSGFCPATPLHKPWLQRCHFPGFVLPLEAVLLESGCGAQTQANDGIGICPLGSWVVVVTVVVVIVVAVVVVIVIAVVVVVICSCRPAPTVLGQVAKLLAVSACWCTPTARSFLLTPVNEDMDFTPILGRCTVMPIQTVVTHPRQNPCLKLGTHDRSGGSSRRTATWPPMVALAMQGILSRSLLSLLARHMSLEAYTIFSASTNCSVSDCIAFRDLKITRPVSYGSDVCISVISECGAMGPCHEVYWPPRNVSDC